MSLKLGTQGKTFLPPNKTADTTPLNTAPNNTQITPAARNPDMFNGWMAQKKDNLEHAGQGLAAGTQQRTLAQLVLGSLDKCIKQAKPSIQTILASEQSAAGWMEKVLTVFGKDNPSIKDVLLQQPLVLVEVLKIIGLRLSNLVPHQPKQIAHMLSSFLSQRYKTIQDMNFEALIKEPAQVQNSPANFEHLDTQVQAQLNDIQAQIDKLSQLTDSYCALRDQKTSPKTPESFEQELKNTTDAIMQACQQTDDLIASLENQMNQLQKQLYTLPAGSKDARNVVYQIGLLQSSVQRLIAWEYVQLKRLTEPDFEHSTVGQHLFYPNELQQKRMRLTGVSAQDLASFIVFPDNPTKACQEVLSSTYRTGDYPELGMALLFSQVKEDYHTYQAQQLAKNDQEQAKLEKANHEQQAKQAHNEQKALTRLVPSIKLNYAQRLTKQAETSGHLALLDKAEHILKTLIPTQIKASASKEERTLVAGAYAMQANIKTKRAHQSYLDSINQKSVSTAKIPTDFTDKSSIQALIDKAASIHPSGTQAKEVADAQAEYNRTRLSVANTHLQWQAKAGQAITTDTVKWQVLAQVLLVKDHETRMDYLLKQRPTTKPGKDTVQLDAELNQRLREHAEVIADMRNSTQTEHALRVARENQTSNQKQLEQQRDQQPRVIEAGKQQYERTERKEDREHYLAAQKTQQELSAQLAAGQEQLAKTEARYQQAIQTSQLQNKEVEEKLNIDKKEPVPQALLKHTEHYTLKLSQALNNKNKPASADNQQYLAQTQTITALNNTQYLTQQREIQTQDLRNKQQALYRTKAWHDTKKSTLQQLTDADRQAFYTNSEDKQKITTLTQEVSTLDTQLKDQESAIHTQQQAIHSTQQAAQAAYAKTQQDFKHYESIRQEQRLALNKTQQAADTLMAVDLSNQIASAGYGTSTSEAIDQTQYSLNLVKTELGHLKNSADPHDRVAYAVHIASHNRILLEGIESDERIRKQRQGNPQETAQIPEQAARVTLALKSSAQEIEDTWSLLASAHDESSTTNPKIKELTETTQKELQEQKQNISGQLSSGKQNTIDFDQMAAAGLARLSEDKAQLEQAIDQARGETIAGVRENIGWSTDHVMRLFNKGGSVREQKINERSSMIDVLTDAQNTASQMKTGWETLQKLDRSTQNESDLKTMARLLKDPALDSDVFDIKHREIWTQTLITQGQKQGLVIHQKQAEALFFLAAKEPHMQNYRRGMGDHTKPTTEQLKNTEHGDSSLAYAHQGLEQARYATSRYRAHDAHWGMRVANGAVDQGVMLLIAGPMGAAFGYFASGTRLASAMLKIEGAVAQGSARILAGARLSVAGANASRVAILRSAILDGRYIGAFARNVSEAAFSQAISHSVMNVAQWAGVDPESHLGQVLSLATGGATLGVGARIAQLAAPLENTLGKNILHSLSKEGMGGAIFLNMAQKGVELGLESIGMTQENAGLLAGILTPAVLGARGARRTNVKQLENSRRTAQKPLLAIMPERTPSQQLKDVEQLNYLRTRLGNKDTQPIVERFYHTLQQSTQHEPGSQAHLNALIELHRSTRALEIKAKQASLSNQDTTALFNRIKHGTQKQIDDMLSLRISTDPFYESLNARFNATERNLQHKLEQLKQSADATEKPQSIKKLQDKLQRLQSLKEQLLKRPPNKDTQELLKTLEHMHLVGVPEHSTDQYQLGTSILKAKVAVADEHNQRHPKNAISDLDKSLLLEGLAGEPEAIHQRLLPESAKNQAFNIKDGGLPESVFNSRQGIDILGFFTGNQGLLGLDKCLGSNTPEAVKTAHAQLKELSRQLELLKKSIKNGQLTGEELDTLQVTNLDELYALAQTTKESIQQAIQATGTESSLHALKQALGTITQNIDKHILNNNHFKSDATNPHKQAWHQFFKDLAPVKTNLDALKPQVQPITATTTQTASSQHQPQVKTPIAQDLSLTQILAGHGDQEIISRTLMQQVLKTLNASERHAPINITELQTAKEALASMQFQLEQYKKAVNNPSTTESNAFKQAVMAITQAHEQLNTVLKNLAALNESGLSPKEKLHTFDALQEALNTLKGAHELVLKIPFPTSSTDVSKALQDQLLISAERHLCAFKEPSPAFKAVSSIITQSKQQWFEQQPKIDLEELHKQFAHAKDIIQQKNKAPQSEQEQYRNRINERIQAEQRLDHLETSLLDPAQLNNNYAKLIAIIKAHRIPFNGTESLMAKARILKQAGFNKTEMQVLLQGVCGEEPVTHTQAPNTAFPYSPMHSIDAVLTYDFKELTAFRNELQNKLNEHYKDTDTPVTLASLLLKADDLLWVAKEYKEKGCTPAQIENLKKRLTSFIDESRERSLKERFGFYEQVLYNAGQEPRFASEIMALNPHHSNFKEGSALQQARQLNQPHQIPKGFDDTSIRNPISGRMDADYEAFHQTRINEISLSRLETALDNANTRLAEYRQQSQDLQHPLPEDPALHRIFEEMAQHVAKLSQQLNKSGVNTASFAEQSHVLQLRLERIITLKGYSKDLLVQFNRIRQPFVELAGYYTKKTSAQNPLNPQEVFGAVSHELSLLHIDTAYYQPASVVNLKHLYERMLAIIERETIEQRAYRFKDPNTVSADYTFRNGERESFEKVRAAKRAMQAIESALPIAELPAITPAQQDTLYALCGHSQISANTLQSKIQSVNRQQQLLKNELLGILGKEIRSLETGKTEDGLSISSSDKEAIAKQVIQLETCVAKLELIEKQGHALNDSNLSILGNQVAASEYARRQIAVLKSIKESEQNFSFSSKNTEENLNHLITALENVAEFTKPADTQAQQILSSPQFVRQQRALHTLLDNHARNFISQMDEQLNAAHSPTKPTPELALQALLEQNGLTEIHPDTKANMLALYKQHKNEHT